MLALASASLSFAGTAAPMLRASRTAGVSMGEKALALPFLDRPKNLDGSMAGDVGFDPLGLSDSFWPLAWMREAEIKHGRVCMLGVVGWIAVDQGLRAPGVAGKAAFDGLTSFKMHDATVTSGHMFVLLFGCMVCEIAGYAGIAETLKGNREPGDFALTGGFGKTPEQMQRLKLAEIKHCRLAMMAFGGIATQQACFPDVPFPYF